MTLDAMLFLAAAVTALSVKPGPGMMFAMSRTISQGMGACLAGLLGYLLIAFLYLVVVFISFNIPGLDMVFIIILIKALAAVYLIWVGFKGLNDVHLVYNVDDIEGHSFFDNFSSAIMVSISNPLVVVFYAGILPTMMDVQMMTLKDMGIITLIVLGIEGIIPVCYCLPLALFRKKIPMDFLKGMRIFSSIVIIIIGLYIGYTALPAKDLLSVF